MVNIKEQSNMKNINYERILNDLNIGFYRRNVQGNLIKHNSTFNNILGYEPNEILIGSNIQEFLINPDEFDKYNSELIKNDLIKNFTIHIKDKFGKIKVILLNSHLIRDSEKKPIEIEGTFIDITEKYELQLELKDLKELHRLISECEKTVIFSIDMNMKFTNINPYIYDLLGYTPDEVINKNVAKFNTPASLKIIVNAFKEELKKERKKIYDINRVHKLEVQQIHKNGSIIDVEIVCTFLRDDEKKPIGIFGISRNISERKEIEQKMKENEEKFRLAFENASDAIFWAKPENGILTNCNKAAEVLLERSREEIIGKHQATLHPPNEVKKYTNMFKEHIEKKNNISEEATIITKSGKIKPVLITASQTKIKGESIHQGLFREISDIKKMETQVRESESRFRKIFTNSPFGIELYDFNGKLIELNNACLKLFGLKSKEEVIGFDLFNDPNLPENAIEKLKNLKNVRYEAEFDFEKVKELNLYKTTKSGKLFLDVTIIPLFSVDSKKILNYLVEVQDISKRKISEQNLIESQKKYQQAYERANFYKELIAHDMRNILQAIQSSVELYRLSIKNPEIFKPKRDFLSIITENVFNGSQLTSNAIKLSEIEETKETLESINVNKYLMDAVVFIHKNFQTRNLNITVGSPKEDYYILANNLILDLFENILMNSIKHNKNSLIEIRVGVSEVEIHNKKYCKIEFIDNGEGIPEEKKEKIFDRRIKNGSSGRGMGIGLSLVKQIIDSYDGKIWIENKVKSDYTKGSNFIILIPTPI